MQIKLCHVSDILIKFLWQDRFNLIELGRKMLTNSWRVISNSTSGRLTLKVKKTMRTWHLPFVSKFGYFKCYLSFRFLTFYVAEILANLTKVFDIPGRVNKYANFRDFMMWREDDLGTRKYTRYIFWIFKN